ncbi:MAG TPA: spore coat U domain-containing protein [Acetobacteraceae bacterium]|nr:spore coat U domain-containing protein [Acetobacteraceae bacterium]
MRRAAPVLAVLMLVAGTAAARAQTCTAAASAVAFGVYDPGTGAPTDTTGTVTVTCSALISLLVSYTITLTTGGGGSFAARSMAGPLAPRLAYQIYADAARTRIWGDGTGGTSTVTDGYLLQLLGPVVRQYTMYARIPAGQLVSAGTFGDTVTVVVTY